MNFAFDNQFETQELLQTVNHLVDTANELELELPFSFAVDQEMEAEQLQTVQQLLLEAIEEELKQQELLKRPPCHIGPYADGRCTICGLAQP